MFLLSWHYCKILVTLQLEREITREEVKRALNVKDGGVTVLEWLVSD